MHKSKAKKKICVFPISRPTHHFLGDRLRFFYCATQSYFYWGSYRKKCKSDHFERSYEVLKTKFSKISANIDTCLKYLKRNLTPRQYKNISPFFRLPTQVFLLCDSKFFYWGSYIKKICKSDHFERSSEGFKSKFL